MPLKIKVKGPKDLKDLIEPTKEPELKRVEIPEKPNPDITVRWYDYPRYWWDRYRVEEILVVLLPEKVSRIYSIIKGATTMNPNIKEKTSTGLGIGIILTAVGSVLTALYDGDPLTNPAWETAISSLIGGVSMLFASFKKPSV